MKHIQVGFIYSISLKRSGASFRCTQIWLFLTRSINKSSWPWLKHDFCGIQRHKHTIVTWDECFIPQAASLLATYRHSLTLYCVCWQRASAFSSLHFSPEELLSSRALLYLCPFVSNIPAKRPRRRVQAAPLSLFLSVSSLLTEHVRRPLHF